jgi:hypothetical protein
MGVIHLALMAFETVRSNRSAGQTFLLNDMVRSDALEIKNLLANLSGAIVSLNRLEPERGVP